LDALLLELSLLEVLGVLEVLEVLEVVVVEGVALSDDFSVEAAAAEPAAPLAADVEERESVMYQPLPLKTMPTGWITLRKLPPHCSHVVNGASEKLWRFSITSLHDVQVYV
jgi:hypothetical protein